MNDVAKDTQWDLWEVFVQEKSGDAHRHAGSVHAADAEGALQNARDVYTRLGNVGSLWVVPSASITATTRDDRGPFFDPAEDKIYRHPSFYRVDRNVKNL